MTHLRLSLIGIVALWIALPTALSAPSVECETFSGTWRLERVTDGERSRTDLNERLTFRCEEGSIAMEYQITDRFGTRTLDLAAPLDGRPREQRVQSRRALVAARIEDGQLELRIERDAPFGHIHNQRQMRSDLEGRRLESLRTNFKNDGSEHSKWRETWVRVE
jgi:hypothetical protein